MNITKESILAAVTAAPLHGYKVGELAIVMELDTKGRHRLRRLLEELTEAGTVERGPGARYRLAGSEVPMTPPPRPTPPSPAPVTTTTATPAPSGATTPGVTGMIRVHPAGYGFVERDDGEPDVFVPARYRGTALDGDKVRLSTWMGYKGTEGRVDEVVSRGRAKLTGIIKKAAGRHVYLEPDDPRIASTYGHVGLEDGAQSARDGQCVVAEITRYPTGAGGELWARVTHVLGDSDDPRTEVLKVIACADIPDTFPEDALAAAARTPQQLVPEDFADRIDLRDRPFLTIDPETARDFDDAICLEPRGSGWRLWVAVADVSHYVRPGNALDREARIRGCSVYLPDRAIPMLPRELSAEMCSLKPEVDRCAMVVRMDLDANGVVQAKHYCAAVIQSHARLDYPGVAAALAGDLRGSRARYAPWVNDLRALRDLSKKMRARRRERGSLDFDIPEATVILDEDNPRLVRDVRRSKANPEVKEAYQLVEEMMLAANEAVALFFTERELTTVWRVHGKPSVERLTEFAALAESYGVTFDPEEGTSPRVLRKVLEDVAGRPSERALSFMLLRSMKQATYDIVNVGHFGLASTDYLHFTSPIRRYPDLIVHRLLKYYLRREGEASGGAEHLAPPLPELLAAMAAESSAHERRAASAEREVKDMYRAFLMRDRVGEELEGIVSGVTNFGIFIECLDPFVEGLIKLEQLGSDSNDTYQLDDKTLRLVGRRSGRAFALGDSVKVRVLNVSVARRRIDLGLLAGGIIGDIPVPTERRARGDFGPKGKGKPKGRGERERPSSKPAPKRGGGGGRRGR